MASSSDATSGVWYCASEGCGGLLTYKANQFWPCRKCNKTTCLQCNAQHDGENCEAYKKRKDEEKARASSLAVLNAASRQYFQGECSSARSCDKDQGKEDAEKREKFIPGKSYLCGVDGCFFETILHEGSTRFWCPFCYKRHRIEDGFLIRTEVPPEHVKIRPKYYY